MKYSKISPMKYSKIRAAEGPKNIRERVAYALAAHDAYSDTRYTRLLDEELDELHGILNFIASPLIRNTPPPTGCLHALIRAERSARGWEESGQAFVNITPDIVDETWPEWLPMADAALTALMVIPEIAEVLNRPTKPAKMTQLPKPIPPRPKRPSPPSGPDDDPPCPVPAPGQRRG